MRHLLRYGLFALLAASLALSALAAAEVTQRGHLRLHFDGRLQPNTLPRGASAPIRLSFDARIGSTDAGPPPQLRALSIAINRHGRLDAAGLPVCHLDQIQPASNAQALAACRRSLVGQGHFSARVLIPGATPFPSNGKVYAFNGVIGCSPSERRLRSLLGGGTPGSESAPNHSRASQPTDSFLRTGWLWPSSSRTQGARGGERAPARDPNPSDRGQRDAKCHSHPAIFAHVYGTQPVPTSTTLRFELRPSAGTFGTTLAAKLPRFAADAGYVTGLSLDLGRKFKAGGRRRSYLSASCPVPKGVAIASFALARARFQFAGAKPLSSTLTRSCRVRR